MRLGQGKGNSARKILAFYRVNFGISSPYQVLCDGPTIYLSLKNDLYIKESLPKLLGTTAYPVLTNCIVEELKALGEEYSNAALFAKRVTRIPCAHENPVSATECLISRVKKNEDQKCIVATNDAEILVKLTRIPGVPVITVVNETKLILKPPSRVTNEVVRKGEQKKSFVLNESDKALVEKIKAADLDSRKQNNKRLRKRKRSKEPNPLSVKKSKVRHETNQDENEDKIHQPTTLTDKKSEANTENLKEMTIPEKTSAPMSTGKKKRKRYRSKTKPKIDEQTVISKETAESGIKTDAHPDNNEVKGDRDQGNTLHSKERKLLDSTKLNEEKKKESGSDKSTREIRSEKAKISEVRNKKVVNNTPGANVQILKSNSTEAKTRNDPTNQIPEASQSEKCSQTNIDKSKNVKGALTHDKYISADEERGTAINATIAEISSASPPESDQKNNVPTPADQPKKKQRKNRRRRPKKVDTEEAVKTS